MPHREEPPAEVFQLVSSTVGDLMGAAETVGVLADGSAVAGEPHFDRAVELLCVIDADWCSMEAREVDGSRVEIQRLPEQYVRELLRRSYASNNNAMLNVLTTGRIVGDKDGRVARLVEEARRLYAQGPALPSLLEIGLGAAFLRDGVSELRRLHSVGDPHRISRVVASELLFKSVYAYCKTHGRWATKFTLMFDRLHESDPAFYTLCADCLRATSLSDQIAALDAIVDAVLSPVGSVPVAYQTPRLPLSVAELMRAGLAVT